jgi:1,4-dihydroxy-2-naphthoyl-CoA hydrolase
MEQEAILTKIQERCANTFVDTLDIKFIEVGEDYLVAKMPVRPAVLQLDGVLHGGATAGLAETVGSAACAVFRAADDVMIRGIEVSANHVRGVRSGHVYAKAVAAHMGKTMQLWQITITDDDNKLVSSCKLTTLSLSRKK